MTKSISGGTTGYNSGSGMPQGGRTTAHISHSGISQGGRTTVHITNPVISQGIRTTVPNSTFQPRLTTVQLKGAMSTLQSQLATTQNPNSIEISKVDKTAIDKSIYRSVLTTIPISNSLPQPSHWDKSVNLSAQGEPTAPISNPPPQPTTTQIQNSVETSTEDKEAVPKLLNRIKQFSSKHKIGATLGVLLVGFVIFCAVAPTSCTGLKEDEEILTSVKTFVDGKETITTTKEVSGKTLWDWMSLILAPATLTGLGFWFQHLQQKQADEAAKLQQKQTDEAAELQQKQADKAAREEVLQAYFDPLSTLLIDKNVIAIAVRQNSATSESSADQVTDRQKELIEAAKDVIRARTLSVLRRLGNDGERKANVIQFLIETEIISKLQLDLSSANLRRTHLRNVNLSGANLRNADLYKAILYEVDLSSANLRNADLKNADLRRANLRNADLSSAFFSDAFFSNADLSNANLSSAFSIQADLSNARLIRANLSGANLKNADLSNARLICANLRGADLSGTNLKNADLSGADLSGANLSNADFQGAILFAVKLLSSGLEQKQLTGSNPPLLYATELPNGMETFFDRDCTQLPQVLLERYPKSFKTLEEVKQYMEAVQKRKL